MSLRRMIPCPPVAPAAIAAVVLLAGCGAQRIDLAHACAEVETSGTVPACTATYDGARGVRLPAGSADAPVGAITRGGSAFVAASGARFRTEPLRQLPTTFDTAYATTVYQAKIVGGVATDLKPIMRIPDEVILTHAFGSRVLWGHISARLPDGTYDVRPDLPVVIRLDARAKRNGLGGTIVNADRDVRVGGGKCLERLTGASNPLVDGFTRRIHLVRAPSMHTPYSDELVLEWSESSSGMGDSYYPSVATVMGRDPLARVWDVVQHGVPNSGPALRLRLGAGEITACSAQSHQGGTS